MINHLEKKAMLLAKKSLCIITADEQELLKIMMADDDRYCDFQNKLTEDTFVRDELSAMSKIDPHKALQEMQERIASSKTRKSLIVTPLLYRVAAIVILIIVGGSFWYHRQYTRVTPPVIAKEVQLAMERSRACDREGAEIVKTSQSYQGFITEVERILYHVDKDFAEELTKAKRITTYHDKEYWVTLDDGTLVHLNYNTRLIYPEKFGDRRDVILEGEAYFMVAKDKSRQFVVHTPHGEVKVYGTEFMVNTREECQGKTDRATTVVLIEGSVGITLSNGKEMMISPGQKLYIENDKQSIKEEDTTPYVAWNNGFFVFKKSTLESLMNVISQWYGVKDVSFSNDDLRTIHFTGNLGSVAIVRG